MKAPKRKTIFSCQRAKSRLINIRNQSLRPHPPFQFPSSYFLRVSLPPGTSDIHISRGFPGLHRVFACKLPNQTAWPFFLKTKQELFPVLFKLFFISEFCIQKKTFSLFICNAITWVFPQGIVTTLEVQSIAVRIFVDTYHLTFDIISDDLFLMNIRHPFHQLRIFGAMNCCIGLSLPREITRLTSLLMGQISLRNFLQDSVARGEGTGKEVET